MGLANTA